MIDERDEQIHQFHEQMAGTVEKWIKKTGGLDQYRTVLLDYVLKGKELDQTILTEKQLAEVQGLQKSWTEKGVLIQDYQTQIGVLENIVKLLGRRQDAQFDKWDSIADPKNQVTIPIGDPVQASAEGIDKACELYFQLLPKYEHQLRIANNAQTLAKKETRKEIQNGLAKDVLGIVSGIINPLQDKRARIDCLLEKQNTSQTHEVYEILKTMSGSASAIDRKLTEEIAFYKYALNGGLQTALQADGNVSYGKLKVDLHQELAIPL